MKKSVSSSILCLLFSIAVGSARGVVEPDACSSSCGPVSIRYPFRLKGDPATCGNPDFELVCSHNNTILDLISGKYYATQISYEDKTIQVVEDNLVHCKLPFHFPSVGTDNTGRYFLTIDSESATVVNCSVKIPDDDYLYISPHYIVPCLSRRDMFVYVIVGSQVQFVPPNCSYISRIPLSVNNRLDFWTSLPSNRLNEQFSMGWRDRNVTTYQMIQKNLTRSQMIQGCLEEAKRDIKLDNQGKNILVWLKYPYDLGSEVLECLKTDEYLKIPRAPFNLALVCILFFDILVTLLATSMLIRFIVAPLFVYVFLVFKCCKMIVPDDNIEKFLRNEKILGTKRYTYTDIIAMTSHFNEKIGQGGFGSVYKGVLPGGYLVAVKMLGNSSFNGDEFINEVSTIGRIHHMNVVRLVGFCSEASKRALIYEFMPNGSLDKYIFSSNGERRQFTPEELNKMALGVARGIDYLHKGCDMRILHFDIKPHNILLDQNFNPKVADFGLAKLYPKDHTLASISVARGTIGYIAPELVSRSFGLVSYKSDVYSFGMLLLEMAGGRRNVDNRAENSSQVYYPSWIYDRLVQSSEGPEICNSIDIGDMERKLCQVGLWCIQMRPSDRPCMSKVIEMLEADVHTLQMPPKPFMSTSASKSPIQSYVDSSLSELSIISEDD